jgi:mycothiol system anti-sigma-R factor
MMMNCLNCLQTLYPYIDRELTDAEIQQVQIHLEACPPCLHLFHFEDSLRRLVKVRCHEQRAPDSLRTRIQAQLVIERQRVVVRRVTRAQKKSDDPGSASS